MSSSNQNKNTQVSETAPAVSNGEGRQLARLSSAVEQALCEAITAFCAMPAPPKWPWAYRDYWFSCRAANLGHVSPLQFFERLQQDRPSVVAVPRGSHFLAVAQIDQVTVDLNLIGGASS